MKTPTIPTLSRYPILVNLDQLKNRLLKRDVLSESKQAIYDRVKKYTEIFRQFTPLKELAREIRFNSKTVADYAGEIMDVYDDLRQVEIGVNISYYLDTVLKPDEFELERKRWESEISGQHSYKNALGHAQRAR